MNSIPTASEMHTQAMYRKAELEQLVEKTNQESEKHRKEALPKKIRKKMNDCMRHILIASKRGSTKCYCDYGTEEIESEIKTALTQKGYAVEKRWVKMSYYDAETFLEKDGHPYQAKKFQVLYLSWDKNYQPGILNPLCNWLFTRASFEAEKPRFFRKEDYISTLNKFQ